jgi:taurine transport system substrate-binding protein
VRSGSGIKTPADLAGKTVAVPFVTTPHYSLLAALKHWNIDASRLRIVNMRVSEVPAAWQGRNIDAAYVFEPALGVIKESGSVLATSADVAGWGAPTYDVWVVRSDYAAAHPAVVAAFARSALQSMQDYRTDPQRFLGAGGNLDRIVRATGAKASQVPLMLAGNSYPLAQEQRAQLAGTFVKALADTSAFLKSQGKIDAVLPDYQRFATPRFVPDAGDAVATH